MTVETLFKGLPGSPLEGVDPAIRAAMVTRVTGDSRAVVPGTVFVAFQGVAKDGHEFIFEARMNGAILVVAEKPRGTDVIVPSGRSTLAALAASFHGHPSREMLVIGVTGTSGKTTTTYLIESILQAAGHKVGLIGTVSCRYPGKEIAAVQTTPDAVELQRLLHEMKDAGCSAVVMEVSSHALRQERVSQVAFDGMVFTNLSPEHQDFHPDMDHYFESKALLFTEGSRVAVAAGKQPVAAVNVDDPYGLRLKALCPPETCLEVSLKRLAGKFEARLEGIRGEVRGLPIRSELAGEFNAYNILSAVTIAQGLSIPSEAIAEGVASLKVVPGRLERVPNQRGIHVLVDYAHKPDALEKVLHTLRDSVRREGQGGRLLTVFGCGGDRDRKKRAVMGKLAVNLSDQVVITSDNPRTENPGAIIREILEGTSGHANFTVEEDRKKAIRAAVALARAGDVIVIAGKGHEDYQIIGDPASPGGTRKIHFDDREVAAEALR